MDKKFFPMFVKQKRENKYNLTLNRNYIAYQQKEDYLENVKESGTHNENNLFCEQ